MGTGQGRSRPDMTYEIALAPSPARQLRKFDPQVRLAFAGHAVLRPGLFTR